MAAAVSCVEDARALHCEAALRRIQALLDEGTSAHEQLRLYRAARQRGAPRAQALRAVADWLIEMTLP